MGRGMIERRKEIRYTIPQLYQTQIQIKIRTGSVPFEPGRLLDVSLRGIKLSSRFRAEPGAVIGCLISPPQTTAEEVVFYAEVHYCVENNGSFVIGAETVQISEKVWVTLFFQIHDFVGKTLRSQTQHPLLI